MAPAGCRVPGAGSGTRAVPSSDVLLKMAATCSGITRHQSLLTLWPHEGDKRKSVSVCPRAERVQGRARAEDLDSHCPSSFSLLCVDGQRDSNGWFCPSR